MIKKGTWIEIEEVVLEVNDRASNIPIETKATPLKCWTRGNCMEDCVLGQCVEVETNIGRIAKGIVVDVEPGYYHTFGKYVSEISKIGTQAKEMIK
ncbi:2-amino-4-oxopentanoate thiolase subunit OrtA [Clostridium algidicarnis]|uniref:2-amino-4-oxopentanoate thiolase subunit OrtA n=1 Tax=Clostridium algidicarnis TaxID=37659 RepID=UPI001C0CE407|nr:2-amino-4-oxopentanoate thiolase subunit OrtA [Clostridium algidicarnis]MBU3192783.1 2-amino-4-ketopentanoate thiolase [Clostridium algidicarnis]